MESGVALAHCKDCKKGCRDSLRQNGEANGLSLGGLGPRRATLPSDARLNTRNR